MIRFILNDKPVYSDVAADTPLLWVLREDFGLTATRFGCGQGLCGACTIHRNGQAVRSCVTPLAAVKDARVRTMEGLSLRPLHPVQKAWIKHNVPQCGYCQSGQIMQAISILENTDQQMKPAEILAGMRRNLCRCGTYPKIKRALLEAAARMGKIS